LHRVEENEIVSHPITRAAAVAANRDAGASDLVTQLLPILADAIEAGPDVSVAVARVVCDAHPAMAPLWRVCAAAVADHQTPGRFARVRAELERASSTLVRVATPALEDVLRGVSTPLLLTLSYSGSVLRVCQALRHIDPDIICGEGRPRFEGRVMAAQLAATRRVTLTTDAALTAYLAKATAVVVGADAIAARFWINKVGTRGLAAAAAASGVPVFVLASRDKALPEVLAARWQGHDGALEEVWPDPPVNVAIRNPYFETISVELATQFLTDLGPLSPDDTAELSERSSADISLLINKLGW
jgi:translation initiation factor 2B subunit (eIF-2B alpha/beta/delta family)